MTASIEQINALDEDERSRKRIAAWGICQQSCNTAGDTVHKRDLSPQAIDCLDRTEFAAKAALGQTHLASPIDQIRENSDVSKTRPAGTNAVIDAAESSGIVGPKIQSLFDLSGSMGKRKEPKEIDTSLVYDARSSLVNLEDHQSSPSSMNHSSAILMQYGSRHDSSNLSHSEALQNSPNLTARRIPSPSTEESRPQLPLPKTLSEKTEPEVKNYLQLVLETLGSMEKVIDESTHHFDLATRKDLQELGKLREAKIAAIQTHVEELSHKESWATLQTIARYLAYASSVAIGFTVGGPAGYFLIAGGGLGLASSIASDTGLWPALAAHYDKSIETQKHIVQSIELATTIIALGLVLFGTSIAAPVQAPLVFTWTSAALSATSKLGEGWSQKKFSDISGQLESLETKIRMMQEKTKAGSKHMQDDLHKIKEMTLEVEKILSGAEIHL